MRRKDRLEGRFEVLSRAGTGGMGEVYKVLDTTTGQVAARKMERLEGEDLAALLRRRRLAADDVVERVEIRHGHSLIGTL
jgi:eukaryotic-like serine/threonine-protein kinase